MDIRSLAKVAIVTSVGSGVGRVTAELLAEEGAKVAVADIDAEGVNGTGSAVSLHTVLPSWL